VQRPPDSHNEIADAPLAEAERVVTLLACESVAVLGNRLLRLFPGSARYLMFTTGLGLQKGVSWGVPTEAA
jgi:hypothetical protein